MLGCYLLDNMPHATTNEDIPLKKTNEDIENMKKSTELIVFFNIRGKKGGKKNCLLNIDPKNTN